MTAAKITQSIEVRRTRRAKPTALHELRDAEYPVSLSLRRSAAALPKSVVRPEIKATIRARTAHASSPPSTAHSDQSPIPTARAGMLRQRLCSFRGRIQLERTLCQASATGEKLAGKKLYSARTLL